ncbi:MAG: AMP-binding protein [Syntrophales bacterium]|nr:AMP-binding protein [Syntrophales bacterium]
MGIDFGIYDLISRNAEINGSKIAFVQDEKRLSHAELKEACDLWAAFFKKKGLNSGERIAVLAPNSFHVLAVLGGAAKLGVVCVLINPRLSTEEIAYILNDVSPRILLISEATELLAKGATSRLPSIPQHKIETVEKIGNFEDRCDPVPASNPAVIIHTAAVTGRPQGAVLTQRNLIACAFQLLNLADLRRDDCYLCFLPLFHIGGLGFTLATMLSGGKTVIMDRFEAQRALELMEREKVTFFVTFPPILSSILDAWGKTDYDVSSVRLCLGVEQPNTIERFLDKFKWAHFYSIYGQTEVMPVSGSNYKNRPGSIGKPALLTRIAILNEAGQPLSHDEVGEICVRSPSVFAGYWNLPEISVRTFREGWHHTGDLGRIDRDGFLWFEGRKKEKELIKTGGENVYPEEVEGILREHVAIEDVCVVGVSDQVWGEIVVAVCVVKSGHTLTDEEIDAFLLPRLARYKRPRRLLFVDKIPRHSDGSVNREAVKKLFHKE